MEKAADRAECVVPVLGAIVDTLPGSTPSMRASRLEPSWVASGTRGEDVLVQDLFRTSGPEWADESSPRRR